MISAFFLGARLNIFTSGGNVYTSKVFLPKGPLMLGFNKVFYCLKWYCLFIIPLDRSSTVGSVKEMALPMFSFLSHSRHTCIL